MSDSSLRSAVQLQSTGALAENLIVRVSADGIVDLASAAGAPTLRGLIGVTLNAVGGVGPVQVTVAGQATILLEVGLTPLAGDTIYVSSTLPGRGINVPPANAVAVATVEDASRYAIDGTVLVNVAPVTSASSGSATVADWPTDVVRYYAVDYDGGDDSNIGYSDADMLTAGTVALKTVERFRDILPGLAAGQSFVLGIKPRAGGATYRNPADDADAKLALEFAGYNRIIIRGTADFSNDATDKSVVGAKIAAAGPNGDSSWTVAAGATASSFTIAAGALPTERSISNKRIRWLTGALAGFSYTIWSSTATAIVPTLNFFAIPAPGDTFVIEDPGVALGAFQIGREGLTGPALCRRVDAAGIATTGVEANSFSAVGSFVSNIAFCEQRGVAANTPIFTVEGVNLAVRYYYFDEVDSFQVVGGVRIEGAGYVKDCPRMQEFSHFGAVASASGAAFAFVGAVAFPTTSGAGCNFWNGIAFYDMRGTPPANANNGSLAVLNTGIFGNAGSATVRPPRFPGFPDVSGGGAIFIKESDVWINGALFENLGAADAITLEGVGLRVQIDGAVGTTGNTGVGINVSRCRDAFVLVGDNTVVSVAGTAGEIAVGSILLGGFVLMSYADLFDTNVIDGRGNEVRSGNASVTSVKVAFDAIPVINKSGGSLIMGDIVRSTGAAYEVATAQADTVANASGALLSMVTSTLDDAEGIAVVLGRGSWVTFDAPPAIGALGYLDDGSPGLATTTVPPNAPPVQKRRLGYVMDVRGSRGRVLGSTELLPTLSDGVAP
jgi:hypothetical protein